MDTFITYDRLRSNTSVHEVSSIQPSVLYHNLKTFVDTFTDADRFESAHLLLPSQGTLKSLSLMKTFGLPKIDLYNSVGIGMSKIYYSVRFHNIDKALTLLYEEPQAILSILWKFKFIDPVSRRIIPNQEKIPILDERVVNSQIYTRLSTTKSTISPWFAFPFADMTDLNRLYIEQIKSNLPFKLSDKSWRKWHLSKNGNWIPRTMVIISLTLTRVFR
jgi:hypothetical protein